MKKNLLLTLALCICSSAASHAVNAPDDQTTGREYWLKTQKDQYAKDLQFFTDWFLALVSYDSQSTYPTEGGDQFPITTGQRDIARFVEDKLNADYARQISLGKMKVDRSDTEYVYVYIPSNIDRQVPSVMLMAHLDVTPEAPGGKITPIVHDNYDKSAIHLPAGITIDPSERRFERLATHCEGARIITSDGSTLLGADDKSGCTVMLGVIDKLMTGDTTEHGDIYFVFSQNEDIGLAADGFDLAYVGGKSPDMVIDIDGPNPEKFSVENFTAAGLKYTFRGNNVHPGDGKADGYADALAAATTFMGHMPPSVHPGATEGKEGYIHCYSLRHATDSMGKEIATDYVVNIRLRYFDKAEGDSLRAMIAHAADVARNGFPLVEILADPEVLQYENIAYTMHPALPDMIASADDNHYGLAPFAPCAERGGTTSAMMAAKGLKGGPCIYSGQQAEHSCYEWVCVEDMIGMSYVVLDIISKIK